MSATSPTWTPARIEELKRLFEAEYTCSQMAREIGVTRNAVIGKLSRLGLSRPGATRGRRPANSHPGLSRQGQVRILRTLRAQAFLEDLPSQPEAAATRTDGLSSREVEVLRLMASGKSNQQIADELVISLNTVFRHVSNIFTKIGVANRTEAAAYAHRQGLI